MNHGEFLNELQRRAAASVMPMLTNAEWERLDQIMGTSFRFSAIVPAGDGVWAISSVQLAPAVARCRDKLAKEVMDRILK